MEQLGFSDCWVAAGRPEPRTTSRFNTRFETAHCHKKILKPDGLMRFQPVKFVYVRDI
jgi:hypothetical protein